MMWNDHEMRCAVKGSIDELVVYMKLPHGDLLMQDFKIK